MLFSGPTEYAIRSLSELARRASSRPVLLDDLVAGTDMPREFTAKVLQRLVRAGILKSVRGRGGGFLLARPDHEITMMHIVEALDGAEAVQCCVVGMETCCDEVPCAQHDLFKPIRQRLKDYLNTTTLADLAASLKAKQLEQQRAGEEKPANGKVVIADEHKSDEPAVTAAGSGKS
jgi:Rrf2 family protein